MLKSGCHNHHSRRGISGGMQQGNLHYVLFPNSGGQGKSTRALSLNSVPQGRRRPVDLAETARWTGPGDRLPGFGSRLYLLPSGWPWAGYLRVFPLKLGTITMCTSQGYREASLHKDPRRQAHMQ